MKAHNMTLTAVALIMMTASGSMLLGCSSSDNTNPAPTVRDAAALKDSGSSKADATTSHADGGGRPGTDGGNAPPDTGIVMHPPDTGTCKSDSSLCNACYTDAQVAANPYTACSEYTKNCVPFTTTVPTHPML